MTPKIKRRFQHLPAERSGQLLSTLAFIQEMYDALLSGLLFSRLTFFLEMYDAPLYVSK